MPVKKCTLHGKKHSTAITLRRTALILSSILPLIPIVSANIAAAATENRAKEIATDTTDINPIHASASIPTATPSTISAITSPTTPPTIPATTPEMPSTTTTVTTDPETGTITTTITTTTSTSTSTSTSTANTGDIVRIPIGQQSEQLNQLARPQRGMKQQQVIDTFGPPLTQSVATGTPPISQWSYRDFTVYFESEYVIHSVLKHTHKTE